MIVPWIVSYEATKITLPEDKLPIICQYGDLVGSAEQSFIQLMINYSINPGKYVTASPCFRDDEIDELHCRYFFKVELINISKTDFEFSNLSDIVENSLELFNKLSDNKSYYIQTYDGFDIMIDNIEVGSYGFRELNDWRWIYGTGYADPRFSMAIMD